MLLSCQSARYQKHLCLYPGSACQQTDRQHQQRHPFTIHHHPSNPSKPLQPSKQLQLPAALTPKCHQLPRPSLRAVAALLFFARQARLYHQVIVTEQQLHPTSSLDLLSPLTSLSILTHHFSPFSLHPQSSILSHFWSPLDYLHSCFLKLLSLACSQR